MLGQRSGGRGRGGGTKGGSKVIVEPHRHEGVFVSKGKEDALVTKNMVPGEAVYNEKRISLQSYMTDCVVYGDFFRMRMEPRLNTVWNPFRSKLAAAILGGVDNIWIVRILALNASYILKNGGHFVISIKANCIDPTVPAEAVFSQEVNKLKAEQFKPAEQVTLEPFERDHACVVGGYRMPKKQKD
uniref:rRNA 2'-O-methyltransferase fibrillarin n=1 Tax=Kalanchoe fedtschenkoi TaxID=63787 RepID=A0A7N0VKA3_KALFE